MVFRPVPVLLLAAAALAGCGTTSTSTPNAKTGAAAPAYAGPVCVMEAPLSPDTKHSVIGEVEASKQWYGHQAELVPHLADEARKLGANAVVKVKLSQQIGLWAWARPVGSGEAISIADFKAFSCKDAGGVLR